MKLVTWLVDVVFVMLALSPPSCENLCLSSSMCHFATQLETKPGLKNVGVSHVVWEISLCCTHTTWKSLTQSFSPDLQRLSPYLQSLSCNVPSLSPDLPLLSPNLLLFSPNIHQLPSCFHLIYHCFSLIYHRFHLIYHCCHLIYHHFHLIYITFT